MPSVFSQILAFSVWKIPVFSSHLQSPQSRVTKLLCSFFLSLHFLSTSFASSNPMCSWGLFALPTPFFSHFFATVVVEMPRFLFVHLLPPLNFFGCTPLELVTHLVKPSPFPGVHHPSSPASSGIGISPTLIYGASLFLGLPSTRVTLSLWCSCQSWTPVFCVQTVCWPVALGFLPLQWLEPLLASKSCLSSPGCSLRSISEGS